jgi:hypothetical protein
MALFQRFGADDPPDERTVRSQTWCRLDQAARPASSRSAASRERAWPSS